MAQVGLQCPRIVPLVCEGVATGVPQHVRMRLETKPCRVAGSLYHAGEAPAMVNGAPRSDMKTNGDFGSCSRCSRRKARSSSPRIG